MRRWRAVTVGALVLVAAGVAGLYGLQVVGNFLVVRDPLAPADAVVAISGDGDERIKEAAFLFRARYAPWLILSGPPVGEGSARDLAQFARQYGIDAGRILLDETALSTYGNAEGTARVMRAHGLGSAILVTSPYHMRRAIVIHRAVFRRYGLTVRAYPVWHSFLHIEGWWMRPEGWRVPSEYVKLALFLIGIK